MMVDAGLFEVEDLRILAGFCKLSNERYGFSVCDDTIWLGGEMSTLSLLVFCDADLEPSQLLLCNRGVLLL